MVHGVDSSLPRLGDDTQNHVIQPKESQTEKDEDVLVIYDDNNIQHGVDTCHNSLIGRFVTRKPILKGPLQIALTSLWNKPKGFRIEELEENVFQFFFKHNNDMNQVLKSSPWNYRNSWLVLHQWCRNWKMKGLNFNYANTWVQL